MSKYAHQPLDFANLQTVSLQARGGKVVTALFAKPHQKNDTRPTFLANLPNLLAADSFQAVIAAICEARSRKRAIS